jgi:eukaryotic-like serine/threonine-protein kinase
MMDGHPMTDPREPGDPLPRASREASEPDPAARGDGAAASRAPPDAGEPGQGAAPRGLEVTPAPLPSESQLGPAPAVAGSDRMRALLRARLFGDDPPGSPADDEERDHASRSGVIGDLDTDPGDSVVRRPDPEAEPELADRIGRFRVLDRLGRGGMGVVYSAYDPELDRKVAIKLLRADVHRGMAKDDAHARLLREAQAMARLSDPNVIVVHEVGTVADRVFVAMEHVDGCTLGQWLRGVEPGVPEAPSAVTGEREAGPARKPGETRRPWREVLDVFLKAGSGLAAAHRAGLVHRDFKPDNVLLGRDGRVRVVDFGLARSVGDAAARTSERTAARAPADVATSLRERPDVDSLATPLTRQGAVMGTPAYMSPEQYKGHLADARSDQFSFCVALYEGLYGVRPFQGSTLTELVVNVLEGRMRETAGELRVPKHVLAALRRGLSVDPDARFPAMEALLTELRRDPGRRVRWGALVLGVGAVTSLATLVATGRDDATGACAELDRELQGVWDDTARAEVTRAIEATGLAYAPRVAATTVQLLDDYTAQWVKMAADACGAALVAKGDDAEHLRRRECLDQRLAEVGALAEALRQPDGGMAETAVKATASLTTGLSACADPRRLAAYELTDDPRARQRLAKAHARLARAKALGVLGHYDQAVALATEVVEQARAAGAGPLEALGLLTRGTYRERAADARQAEADLRAAIDVAERHGDQGTRAQALIVLVYVVAQDRSRRAEARALGEQARAVLAYIDADPLLLADLDNNLGVAARIDHDFDEALVLHRRSHERRVEVLGDDHPDIGRSLLNIGTALAGSREHHAEAEDYLRRALARLEQSLGPHHPTVATALTNLGNCLARQGRLAESLPLQQRALAILEAALGPEHVATVGVLFNLAKVTQDTGQHAEAAAMFQRGLATRERELPPDDERLVGWMGHLARCYLELGRLDEARPLLERSLALRTKHGESPLVLAREQLRLARALAASDPARARRLAEDARDVYARRIEQDGGLAATAPAVRAGLAEANAVLASPGQAPAGEGP